MPEILKYIDTFGLMDLIDTSTIQHSRINGEISEGIVFQLYDRADTVTALKNNPHFGNTHIGFEHNNQVGGKNLDFRSYTDARGSGGTKSLQFDIGPANKVPGAPERALGYADLDCDRPFQSPGSTIRHIIK